MRFPAEILNHPVGDLPERVKCNESDSIVNKRRPIHEAIVSRNLITAKILIKNGAVVNSIVSNEENPLHTAIDHNDFDMVKYLIEEGGADLDAKDNDPWSGGTALHKAIYLDHMEIVELLLKKGAKVDVPNGQGLPPLHYASRWNRLEAIRLLLKYGADIDGVEPSHGDTPLISAASINYLEMIIFLIENGADVNKADNANLTSINYCVALNNFYCVESLIKAGSHSNSAFISAARYDLVEMARILIKHFSSALK